MTHRINRISISSSIFHTVKRKQNIEKLPSRISNPSSLIFNIKKKKKRKRKRKQLHKFTFSAHKEWRERERETERKKRIMMLNKI
jgi:hypothetical protein